VDRKGFIDMSVMPAEFQQTGVGRFARRVSAAISTAWAHYVHNRNQLRDLAALSAMDDTSLRDIGISRLEIRAAIRSKIDETSMRN
jgi:uncharacterized protein YjiS (DUF1127 family)